jgi:hypothetical protein
MYRRFNEALSQDEQLGGNNRSEAQMLAFRDYLIDCGLTDLGYKGYAFTWDNKREGTANVQVRLDRGTTTTSFLSIFPLTQVEHIPTEESDHMALLVKIAAEHPRKVPREAWLQVRGNVYEA